MTTPDLYSSAMEFKALGDGASGEFEAYGAIFGNQDWHGDVIAPGAAAEGLAERASSGRKIAMHLDHGVPQLGGVRNIGVWKHVAEDSKGVLGVGKLVGMNTDAGRMRFEQMREGALPGMSITYAVRPNGARYGKGPNEPKRTLTGINITEMGPVTDPSNTRATVMHFKALMGAVSDPEADLRLESKAALEDLLRGAGLSRGAASKIAGGGWDALSGPESDSPPFDELARALRAGNLALQSLRKA